MTTATETAIPSARGKMRAKLADPTLWVEVVKSIGIPGLIAGWLVYTLTTDIKTGMVTMTNEIKNVSLSVDKLTDEIRRTK